MRPPGTLALSFALATVACAEPFPCNRYCWSHQQAVADLTDEDMSGVPDGRFDGPCNKFSNTKPWHPPLPPLGWYAAETCLPADLHQTIAKTVAAIQDPTVDASQACDVTELQAYAELTEALAIQARDACVAHLTCNGAPAGCDIDPTDPGPQACHIASAEALCDQAVLAPALAALSDLSNGPGAAQPQRDGNAIEYLDDPLDCEPLLQDTDGTPVCDDAGGDSGAGESSGTTGTTGADESSGGGGGAGPRPFGDVDDLVTCTTPTRCTVEAELFAGVTRSFHVFHDEGVWLERVDVRELGRGIRISGLDEGEASQSLLAALGIHDGDILTHVDGASLGSPEAIEQVLLELPTATAWRLSVARREGSRWLTHEHSITRAP
jgi:hypothetical protein